MCLPAASGSEIPVSLHCILFIVRCFHRMRIWPDMDKFNVSKRARKFGVVIVKQLRMRAARARFVFWADIIIYPRDGPKVNCHTDLA